MRAYIWILGSLRVISAIAVGGRSSYNLNKCIADGGLAVTPTHTAA